MLLILELTSFFLQIIVYCLIFISVINTSFGPWSFLHYLRGSKRRSIVCKQTGHSSTWKLQFGHKHLCPHGAVVTLPVWRKQTKQGTTISCLNISRSCLPELGLWRPWLLFLLWDLSENIKVYLSMFKISYCINLLCLVYLHDFFKSGLLWLNCSLTFLLSQKYLSFHQNDHPLTISTEDKNYLNWMNTFAKKSSLHPRIHA